MSAPLQLVLERLSWHAPDAHETPWKDRRGCPVRARRRPMIFEGPCPDCEQERSRIIDWDVGDDLLVMECLECLAAWTHHDERGENLVGPSRGAPSLARCDHYIADLARFAVPSRGAPYNRITFRLVGRVDDEAGWRYYRLQAAPDAHYGDIRVPLRHIVAANEEGHLWLEMEQADQAEEAIVGTR